MKQKNPVEPIDPENLAERDNFENFFQTLWLRVETEMGPFANEPPASSVA